MSAQLRQHPDDLDALVAQVASGRGLPPSYVEKDFWVTEVLRAAVVDRVVVLADGSSGSVTFLFKGGTSLSRVFGIVDRFSEDIDLLAVFPAGAATNARHKVLKDVDSGVTAHLGLAREDVTVGASTTGVKRYTTYHYPVEAYHGALKEGVLRELGSRGGTCPARRHTYRSMVADYALTELGEPEGTWGSSPPSRCPCSRPSARCWSIAAVHDAAVRNTTSTLLEQGRHFYDIDRLLNTPSVVTALTSLGDAAFAELVDDINTHSEEAGFSWSPRPEGGYADSPAFDPTHPPYPSILTGYQSAQHLIHGVHVTFEQVLASVASHRGDL